MRAQLIAVLLLVGILPMIGFMFGVIGTYYDKAVEQKVNDVQTHGNILGNLIISAGYMNPSSETNISVINAEIEQVADIYDGRIILVDRSFDIIKDTYDLEAGKIIIKENIIKGMRGDSTTYVDDEDQYVELTFPMRNTTTKEVDGVMVISCSTKTIHIVHEMLNQKSVLFITTLSIIVFIFAIWYTKLVTRPFKRVTSSIDHISEGYLDEKLNIHGYTELESISDSFNHLITKLQQLENSRQEFVSNVSHELKTPITSVKVLSDSLLMQEDVPVELYREFLVDINEEIERENKIINDLLSLVKLDKTSGEMHISSVNINELLELILKRLRPIAAKRNIELVFESFRPVIAEVDEVKLSLAISNLIENAIKYNFDDGWVRVSLNADHKFFYVKVADSGVGIPEDAIDNIFERFYRVDKARSRETGGTGLGLSITRSAILMHRGAIKVYSKELEGTTFTVRVPLNYIA